MKITPVEVPRVDSPAPHKPVPSEAASPCLVHAICQRPRSMTPPVAMSTAGLQARPRGYFRTTRGCLAETFSESFSDLAFRSPVLSSGISPQDRRHPGGHVEKIIDADRGCPRSASPNGGAPRLEREVRVGV